MNKKPIIILVIPFILVLLPLTLSEFQFFKEQIIKPIKELKELLENVWSKLKEIWYRYFYPFFKDIWSKIKYLVEKRKLIIKKQLEKEREQIKENKKIQSIIEIIRSFWAKIKKWGN
jgi:hypothetical protein